MDYGFNPAPRDDRDGRVADLVTFGLTIAAIGVWAFLAWALSGPAPV